MVHQFPEITSFWSIQFGFRMKEFRKDGYPKLGHYVTSVQTKPGVALFYQIVELAQLHAGVIGDVLS